MTDTCIKVHPAKCGCDTCVEVIEPTINEMEEYMLKKKTGFDSFLQAYPDLDLKEELNCIE